MSRRLDLPLLFGAVWLLVLVQLMAEYWAMTAASMHDADDALRLVQVRSILAGQGWFDLHLARLDPPAGYDSHWSRLIDAGLAGLFLVFNLFVPHALAERLMAALWPVLWLIPTIGGAVAIAWRLAGREAALVVLLLALFGMPGMGQFRPGRIDHHNVQIALAIVAVAATVWSDRVRWAAVAAGATTGLALTIGFEGLPLLVLCGAAFTLRYVADRAAARALTAYGLSLALSVLAGFLVSVSPDRWTQGVCDTLAINTAGAAAAGGLALSAIATWVTHARPHMRFAAVSGAAALALAVFLVLEPRCLGGPYALMEPELRAIWLAHMSEMQSLAELMRKGPTAGVATAAYPVLALIALVMVALSANLRRDFGALVAGTAFVLAFVVMLAATKFYAYAMWLGVPLVAVAALQIFRTLQLDGLLARFVATLLITPVTVTIGAMTIASAAGIDGLTGVTSSERKACTHKDSYATLAQLPPGLMVANQLEWGPYLLAWTPHSVLAAPYHRLSVGIATAHRVFAGPPAEAHRTLTDAGATYLVVCGRLGTRGLAPEQRAASLAGKMEAGEIPHWLEPVPETRGQAFVAYRIRP
jgi:hypothetical protein